MTPQELKSLNDTLWEGVQDARFVSTEDTPKLTVRQLDAVIACIKAHKLICDIRMAGFFGSIGLLILDGPEFPGTEPTSVAFLTQYHLPKKYYPQSHRPTQGYPPDDAWALFSSLALSDENLGRLKWVGLKAPRSNQSDYAY